MDNISVLLIGDEDRRNMVKKELRGRRGINLAGEICEANALRLVPQLDADVVVLDFGSEKVNSLTTLPWLHDLPGERSIVVLGANNTPAERRLALELGADVYATAESAGSLINALVATAAQRHNMAGVKLKAA